MSRKEEIQKMAIGTLSENPNGIHYSDLVRLVKEKFKDYGIELSLDFKGNKEEWILYPRGKVMLLKSPQINEGGRTYFVPDVRYLSPLDDSPNRPKLLIEKVCAGEEEIRKMIEESPNMKYYSSDFRRGNIILGRTDMMNFLANIGLDLILPNPVRFKGY